MKLEKTKPQEIHKDPEKAAADRRAKSKAVGEVLLFGFILGLILWFLNYPASFKAALAYILRLIH